MDHELPEPPGSEGHGHEMTDVALRPIIIFLVVLVVFGGLLQGAMTLVMRGYATADAKIAVPSADVLQDHDNLNKPAPLQKDTTRDMLVMYDQEDAILDTYHVDTKTKAIRIPIERAMRVIAKKGLPSRANPPKRDASKELPYPARSVPYKANY